MNADSLLLFSLGPQKTSNTRTGLVKLANVMGASTFCLGDTEMYGCGTYQLWLILSIV